jgi:antitoxin MazE
MRISKWGNSLAVRIPKDLVDELGLVEGDHIALTRRGAKSFGVSKVTREEALENIRRLARPLPEGWRFDREEANAR